MYTDEELLKMMMAQWIKEIRFHTRVNESLLCTWRPCSDCPALDNHNCGYSLFTSGRDHWWLTGTTEVLARVCYRYLKRLRDSIRYPEPELCMRCCGSGEGLADGTTCPECKGQGVVL